MTDKPETEPKVHSSPCFAEELEQNADGSFSLIDRQQKTDVARWRKAERQRLIDERLTFPKAQREAVTAQVESGLSEIISPREGQIISVYWPFRGELDLRPWMRFAVEGGARIALPIVVQKHHPLAFREWTPDCKMERGIWNILQPADDRQIVPNIVLSPLVGYDPQCYRLGYGGGFFDRTLAAMDGEKPLVIGVGLPSSAIPTIFPQPHDIPMDVILVGGGPIYPVG